MSIKRIITKLAEKLTGRKCTSCQHNVNSRCCHPNGKMFMRCWNSCTRPGYERKRRTAKIAELTPEQEYQLQKIRETLAEAEDLARESGLLEE